MKICSLLYSPVIMGFGCNIYKLDQLMNLFYDDFIWVCRQLLTKILGGLFEGLMYSSWMLFRSLSYYFFLTVSAYVGFAGDRLSRIYRVL